MSHLPFQLIIFLIKNSPQELLKRNKVINKYHGNKLKNQKQLAVHVPISLLWYIYYFYWPRRDIEVSARVPPEAYLLTMCFYGILDMALQTS